MNAGEAGIAVEEASISNMISRNSIHDNAGSGISLINGGNNHLVAPVITDASCGGSVKGTASGGPGWYVQIFSDDADEGRIWESTTTTNAAGEWSWSGPLNGPNLRETVRNAINDTSEFSIPFNLDVCNTAPTAAFTVQPSNGTPTTTFVLGASGSTDLEDSTSDLAVRWDLQNDGIFETNWNTIKILSHTFGSVGDYFVRLQVRDTGNLTDDQVIKVVVRVVLPSKDIYLPIIFK